MARCDISVSTALVELLQSSQEIAGFASICLPAFYGFEAFYIVLKAPASRDEALAWHTFRTDRPGYVGRHSPARDLQSAQSENARALFPAHGSQPRLSWLPYQGELGHGGEKRAQWDPGAIGVFRHTKRGSHRHFEGQKPNVTLDDAWRLRRLTSGVTPRKAANDCN